MKMMGEGVKQSSDALEERASGYQAWKQNPTRTSHKNFLSAWNRPNLVRLLISILVLLMLSITEQGNLVERFLKDLSIFGMNVQRIL